MAGRLPKLTLTAAEKSEVTGFAGRPKTAQAVALRARIILACAEGMQNKDVAHGLGTHPISVITGPVSSPSDGGAN